MKKCLFFWMIIFSCLSVYGQVKDSSSIQNPADGRYSNGDETVMVGTSMEKLKNAGLLVYPVVTSSVINVVKTTENNNVYTGKFLDTKGNVVKTVIIDALFNEINLKDFKLGTYVFRIFAQELLITEISIIIDKPVDQ